MVGILPACGEEDGVSRWRAVAVAAMLMGSLSACTAGDDARTLAAETLAAQLAEALSEGEIGDLPLEGGGQAELEVVLDGARRVRADVATAGVVVDGDSATARLTWQWATPGAPWRYDAAADLRWTGESWVVQWAPTLVEPSLADGEALEVAIIPAVRGDILGAGGEPLVTLRRVVRFGIDKTLVPASDAPGSARALARVLGIGSAPYAARVRAAGPRAFVEALVLRRSAAAAIDSDSLAGIPGAVGIPDQIPLAPTSSFAAPVLGRVGEATAEIVEASGGTVRPGDRVGLSGLQARYESVLGGTSGVRVAVVGGAGGEGGGGGRTLFATDPVAGAPLRTTIDAQVQRRAEAALAGVRPASALVALRPSTGDVVAVASGPGSGGYSTATVGRYPPGSTMKVVTALALMRAGTQPTDRVPCTDRVVVDGKAFTNYDGYPRGRTGSIPLRSAVANSCNTALISQHDDLADGDLASAAAALGLGVDHDLGFPVYLGQVPAPRSQTDKAAALIGQGRVLASPMAMAAVAASVVEGRAVVPRLLLDVPEPGATPAHPLTEQEAGALRDMMRAVVTEGTATFLADVPGPEVGAKTGTAEFGTEVPPQTHAWMIATRGDLAVSVFVEVGQSGSHTAGPLLESFLRAVS